jgi:hypothetical protein
MNNPKHLLALQTVIDSLESEIRAKSFRTKKPFFEAIPEITAARQALVEIGKLFPAVPHVILTIKNDGDETASVRAIFEPSLSDEHASHRVAAMMLRVAAEGVA